MREYKFQAYDRAENKMISFEELVERSSLYDFLDEFIDPFNEMIGEYESPRIYIQYTGQKDKNGHEIYEGDILQTTKKRNKRKFVVRWNNDIGKYVNVPVDENETSYPCFNTGTLKSLKKIGNIFENPELIETGGKQISLEVAE